MVAYTLFSNKVRLYPNKRQTLDLSNNCGSRRWIYNYFLEMQNRTWEAYKSWNKKSNNGKYDDAPTKRLSYIECAKILTHLRNADNTKWLSESACQVQQQTLRDLDKAFALFVTGKAQHPRFKKKTNRDSARFSKDICVDSNRSSLCLGKLGWIKCRGLRTEIFGCITLQSITISKTAGKWYASILCRITKDKPRKHTRNRACGIDVGVAVPYAIATSTGREVTLGCRYSQELARKEARRKRYQRGMKRKLEAYRIRKRKDPIAKPGANFKKASVKVAAAYKREANFRLDYQHKLSTKIAKAYRIICVEDLSLVNMTRSAAGTVEDPGRSVKAKSGLNREVLRLAHGNFVSMLEYKSRKYGSTLVRVDPRNTSRTCPCCDTVNKNNRKSQAVFKCVECGYTANADLNAAYNIMQRGLQNMELALYSKGS